jgi:glycosyltransferase involved in cell wall biosynthesis
VTPTRIAYVVNTFPKLSETFVAAELAELRRRGREVRVLSLQSPAEELQHEFIACAGLADRTVYGIGTFPEALDRLRPQVIHAHFATEATAAARQLAGELNLPFTFTAHGYDIYRKPPADFAARAQAARAVITVSQANARYITAAFGVPAGHIRVIPCGVDTQRFRPQGQPAQPPHIVCVARLVPVKNLTLLLEACAALRRRRVEFRCLVIGDGPCRAELIAARQRLKLQGLVQFLGPARQTEVLAWWQRATVGVLTSEREGMPVSLIEAAACGVPAVATAVGGLPELVENGLTGLLANPADVGSLAGALERLLRDPALCAQMGRAARRRAVDRFALEAQVDRLLGLWAQPEL